MHLNFKHTPGWWYGGPASGGGCGLVNLNGGTSATQQNTGYVNSTNWYHGIVWYTFFSDPDCCTKDVPCRGCIPTCSSFRTGRQSGSSSTLESDGGSWQTFQGTEMKISVAITESKYCTHYYQTQNESKNILSF